MEIPFVDIWVNELKKIIQKNFIDIIIKNNSEIKFLSILQVSEPYKFSNKSIFSSIFQSLKLIYRLDFKSLFEQVLVLTNLKKDPFDEYDFIINFFKKNKLAILSFFRFTQNGFDTDSVSILNTSYKLLIKNFSDYAYVGLLVSYFAQLDSNIFKKENKNLMYLTHKRSFRVRLNYGIKSLSKIYSDFINQEVTEDYSMCFNDKVGFRASSSVPFYFYDLVNEVQTKLKVFPVIATQESIKFGNNPMIFSKLEEIFSSLPLGNSIFCFVFTPSIFNKSKENYNLRSSFLRYLNKYGKL